MKIQKLFQMLKDKQLKLNKLTDELTLIKLKIKISNSNLDIVTRRDHVDYYKNILSSYRRDLTETRKTVSMIEIDIQNLKQVISTLWTMKL